MFRLVRTAFNTGARFSTSLRTSTIAKREFTRNFIALCNQDITAKIAVPHKHSLTCACGCGIRGAHTKGKSLLLHKSSGKTEIKMMKSECNSNLKNNLPPAFSHR